MSCAFAVFSWHEVLGDDYFKVEMVKNYTGNTVVANLVSTSTKLTERRVEEFKSHHYPPIEDKNKQTPGWHLFSSSTNENIGILDYTSSTKEQIEFEAIKNCAANKLGKQCIADLMGMAFVESSFDIERVWDNGEAIGPFQITYKLHKITKDQARSIPFSTKWTMDNLIRHGYKKNRVVAVMLHNGTPFIDATVIYYNKVNNYK